jgi:hypothetical protein
MRSLAADGSVRWDVLTLVGFVAFLLKVREQPAAVPAV